MANFSAQIEYVFQRPVLENAWYWEIREDEEDVFNADDPLTAFEFIEQLCQSPGNTLKPYSNEQIGLGMEFIFNNACSNLAIVFKVAPVPHERKIEAVAGVMERCLKSPNLACVESALHGLGHMVAEYPSVAEPILDQYLKTPQKIPAAVFNYAKAARMGLIQ